jgi:arginyl-tRNA--protein-N-Asp/Glu arginylyltransferase
MPYLYWDEKIISDFSDQPINNSYNEGYVFTRKEKGHMYQTRSLRIDLPKFKLTSENRRILKKTESVTIISTNLPLKNYDWSIGKLGKDFYTSKFGNGTFSANKIKELFTDNEKSNFNRFFIYLLDNSPIGYCITRETNEFIHYCYPFYDLNSPIPNLGLGMMLKAILYAQEQGKKYIYLGSAQRPGDTYKLQFEGLEWFDGKNWKIDTEELKNILKS